MRAQDFDIRSDEFRGILTADSQVDKVCEGLEFTEGPVWSPSEDCLFFSDVRGNRTMRWSEADGLTVIRDPSRFANGMTLDRQGRLVVAGHGGRTVYRQEPDGSLTTLAESYGGKRLNSPNDIVVKSDGTIWFTDPPYAIRPDQQEQPASYVFRLDPSGELVPVTDDFSRPNGLAFSPDESVLYVADSDQELAHIRALEVTATNALTNSQVLCTIEPGIPDGFRVDTEGRLYTSAGDGVQVFSPNGTLLGKVLCEQSPSNCAFGGPNKRTLYMTARTAVYRVTLAATGAQTP